MASTPDRVTRSTEILPLIVAGSAGGGQRLTWEETASTAASEHVRQHPFAIAVTSRDHAATVALLADCRYAVGLRPILDPASYRCARKQSE